MIPTLTALFILLTSVQVTLSPATCDTLGRAVEHHVRALYHEPSDVNLDDAEHLVELYGMRCPR